MTMHAPLTVVATPDEEIIFGQIRRVEDGIYSSPGMLAEVYFMSAVLHCLREIEEIIEDGGLEIPGLLDDEIDGLTDLELRALASGEAEMALELSRLRELLEADKRFETDYPEAA